MYERLLIEVEKDIEKLKESTEMNPSTVKEHSILTKIYNHRLVLVKERTPKDPMAKPFEFNPDSKIRTLPEYKFAELKDELEPVNSSIHELTMDGVLRQLRAGYMTLIILKEYIAKGHGVNITDEEFLSSKYPFIMKWIDILSGEIKNTEMRGFHWHKKYLEFRELLPRAVECTEMKSVDWEQVKLTNPYLLSLGLFKIKQKLLMLSTNVDHGLYLVDQVTTMKRYFHEVYIMCQEIIDYTSDLNLNDALGKSIGNLMTISNEIKTILDQL